MRFDCRHTTGALLLAAGAALGQGANTTVADFESQMASNNLGGFFYFYDDKPDSGASAITSADTLGSMYLWTASTFEAGAGGSASAVKLAFRYGTRFPRCGEGCNYPPMVGMGTNLLPGGALDLTGATAISFWAKADKPLQVSIGVGTLDVTDNGNFTKLLSIGTEWAKHSVSLAPGADLHQPSWAKSVAWNPANVVSVGWSISKGDNESVSEAVFLMDDVVIEGWTPPVDPSSIACLPSREAVSRVFRAGNVYRLELTAAQARTAGRVTALDAAGRTVGARDFAAGSRRVEVAASGFADGPLRFRVTPR